MAAGDLDIVQGIGDAAFLVAATAGIEARIIAVNSRSPKAFAVVANDPNVRTIADLKGKKVAGLRGSVVHQVFLGALADEGMTEADVEFFPMPIATAASTLLAGRVDAALLVGSEISRAEAAGARVLADGEGRVRGLSLTLASKKLVDERPEMIARFLEMRRETLNYIADHRDAALQIASEQTKQSVTAAAKMLAMYDFDCEIGPDDVKSLKESQQYLLENGIVAREIDIAGLIYGPAQREGG
jgi:ABC-type nitrate/sulfonate/bicarbonate transport systems, periplasmic components